MEAWMSAQSSSAAGTSDSAAGRLGGCITPDSEPPTEPTLGPQIMTPEMARAFARRAELDAEERTHLSEYLAHSILLAPRELAELCEMSRKHRYKVTIRWHPDGTAALSEDSPTWAVDWLRAHRGDLRLGS